MIDVQYRARIDALEAVWQRWAQIGTELTNQQWSARTRCPGWDVAALYAHVGMFPRVVVDPPILRHEPTAPPVAAAEILHGFNTPGGAAHELAEQVARSARSAAAELERTALVELFADTGPRAVAALRARTATSVVSWPAAGAATTWVEALRIVVLESVVHLLDVFDGLGRPPEVPVAGLRETTHLLAELADPVALIEAATGRSTRSPLPILR